MNKVEIKFLNGIQVNYEIGMTGNFLTNKKASQKKGFKTICTHLKIGVPKLSGSKNQLV